MKTIKEVRDYLLENRVDEDGDLNLRYLDFSDFAGDVYISGMKVQGNLQQSGQEVQGNLNQRYQEVEGNLWQGASEIKGDYTCEGIKVGGDIFTNDPTKLLKKITREELAEMGYEVI